MTSQPHTVSGPHFGPQSAAKIGNVVCNKSFLSRAMKIFMYLHMILDFGNYLYFFTVCYIATRLMIYPHEFDKKFEGHRYKKFYTGKFFPNLFKVYHKSYGTASMGNKINLTFTWLFIPSIPENSIHYQ